MVISAVVLNTDESINFRAPYAHRPQEGIRGDFLKILPNFPRVDQGRGRLNMT